MTDDPKTVACDQKQTAPRFVSFDGGEASSQYFLFVESIIITELPTFSEALILWFIAHYVLNLEYEKKIKEVALFFQEFIFDLPATAADKKKSATYLSVTTDIVKFTNN